MYNYKYFWLTNPTIEDITINDVLVALNIANEQIIITYPCNDYTIDILNYSVLYAPFIQMTIYPLNHHMFNEYNLDHFPEDDTLLLPDSHNLEQNNNHYEDDTISHITYTSSSSSSSDE